MAYHILGDTDTILGFGFAGVSGTAVDSADEARAAFAGLIADKALKILVVTCPVAAMIDSELTDHRLSSRPPYVVEIPDIWGTKVNRRTLIEMIQEAVGIKISSRAEE
ncbi:MAG: V-type ATP synthase subunit F [Lentisphaeria bacterium]|nr:V-type ATP synthase subunit F [Lentisphaeria bacterium]